MPDFVTMADENFADWAELLLESITTFHPEAKVWFFDLGDGPSPKLDTLFAQYPNVTRMAWPPSQWRWTRWIDETDFHFYWPGFSLQDRLKMFSRQLRYRLTKKRKDSWVLNKKDFTEQRQQAGRIFSQKPLILKETLGKCEGTLIYVDVDAILLDRLDDALPDGCDVGVTMLPREDRRIGRDPGCGTEMPLPYFTVNAGVIFLRANEKTDVFLNRWLAELDRVRHSLFDQTALAALLYRDNPDAFDEDGGILQLGGDGEKINVAKMPCRIFNRYKIDPLSNKLPGDARVVHFVGAWKSRQHKGIVLKLAKKEISARASSRLEIKVPNGNPA